MVKKKNKKTAKKKNNKTSHTLDYIENLPPESTFLVFEQVSEEVYSHPSKYDVGYISDSSKKVATNRWEYAAEFHFIIPPKTPLKGNIKHQYYAVKYAHIPHYQICFSERQHFVDEMKQLKKKKVCNNDTDLLFLDIILGHCLRFFTTKLVNTSFVT